MSTSTKFIKNNKGEYNYHFNWMDCNGSICGFNDVWAKNYYTAVKSALAMESKAHWGWYDGTEYVTVPEEVTTGGHCYYNKGMYVNLSTMRRATRKIADDMNRLGWMMSM